MFFTRCSLDSKFLAMDAVDYFKLYIRKCEPDKIFIFDNDILIKLDLINMKGGRGGGRYRSPSITALNEAQGRAAMFL